MVERQVVTLKVMSLNLDKGKSFFIINKKVTERMTMVAPSGEQIQSLKNYMLLQKYCKLKYFSDFMSAVMLLFLFETLEDLGPKDFLKLPLKYLKLT